MTKDSENEPNGADGADENSKNSGVEFTPITSAEQLNALLEKQKLEQSKQYSDYDDLKKAAEKLKAIEDKDKSEAELLNERLAQVQAELDEHKKRAESSILRGKIAKETGIAPELLRGDTEEEIKEHALQLAEYLSAQEKGSLYVPGAGKTAGKTVTTGNALLDRIFSGSGR
jgi:hypothetical protein